MQIQAFFIAGFGDIPCPSKIQSSHHALQFSKKLAPIIIQSYNGKNSSWASVSEKKSKLLILYSTVDGHAKHICEYAQDKLKGDKDIIIASLDDDPAHDLSGFDEILLGASVRYGFHRKNVYEFVRENKWLS